jgi:mRNA-degrading endonuclease YafQ of YafQ-DinJ toxin-antitoxin module
MPPEACRPFPKFSLEGTLNEWALELLQYNPHHPSLRLHSLSGRLAGLHSVSINLKYRISIELIITEKEIVLINVGDHGVVS